MTINGDSNNEHQIYTLYERDINMYDKPLES